MDAAAKLQVGDIITAIEGEKVDSVKKLSSVVNRFYAGDIVTLTVYRGNGQITVDIILSAQPD